MGAINILKQALAEMTYDERMVFATFIAEWIDGKGGQINEAITPQEVAQMLSDFYRDVPPASEREEDADVR